MARYIECEAACVEVDKGDLLIGNNAEFAKEIINRTPTADVVPKSEVEELIRENESLAKTVNEASELIRKLRSKVKKSKSDVAREIFEEIENIFTEKIAFYEEMKKRSLLFTEATYAETMITNLTIYLQEIIELKKKYTE